jgi:hypothetical protein
LIKTLQFYVKVGWWNWIEGKRIHLYTNTVNGISGNPVVGSTKDRIIMTDWVNFKEYSGDYYIEPGKIVPFNIAFMFDSVEIEGAHKWQFVVTDFSDDQYKTTINYPAYLSLKIKNMLLFDCYLGKPDDVDDLLKDRVLDSKEIQTFLTSKYRL